MSSYGSSKLGKCSSVEGALEAYRQTHSDHSKPVNVHYMYELLSPSINCKKKDIIQFLQAQR